MNTPQRWRQWFLLGLAATALAVAQTENALTGIFSEPSPRSWPAPAYPADALKDGVEGVVKLQFIVDAEGKITELTVIERGADEPAVDERLQSAALAAAQQWVFAAALNDGKPEPRALTTQVRFTLKDRSGKPAVTLPLDSNRVLAIKPQPVRSARAKNMPDPNYPDEMLPRKLPGSVQFRFVVGVTGDVENIVIAHVSDAGFVGSALATLNRWKFEPAMQGPLAVVSEKVAPMEFEVVGDDISPEAVLKANGIAGLDGNTFDKPPAPLSLPAPIYPRAHLVSGQTGAAEAEFTINEKGFTENILVTQAEQPEFGAALAAAVELWVFKPALRDRERTRMNLRVKHQFAAPEGSPDARLASLLKTGIEGAKGLDQRLTPVWRISPGYPQSLLAEKPTGSATIEFVIDREGRCRAPRVVSATHDAFGWAAATAISQWVFVQPTKQGQPVDVRVSIPVEFTPPEA
ncbi:TonB family protein [Oleiharenicola lentus]|uniref:TonB family protein n=1 Tax=Oleiharenicola lentus TaxID=2508720 RepID=UPI003F6698E8